MKEKLLNFSISHILWFNIFLLFCPSSFLLAQWGQIEWTGGEITAIAMSYNDKNTIYVARFPDGILKTTDGGVTWQRVSNDSLDFSNTLITSIYEHPLNNYLYIVAPSKGFLESRDDGKTWRKLSNSAMNAFVDPRRTGTFFVNNGSTIFSSDNGASWDTIFGADLHDAAFPIDTNLTYLGLRYSLDEIDMIQKSEDCGRTWKNVPTPEGELTSLTVNPHNTNMLGFTVTDRSIIPPAVYISQNGGSTWLVKGDEIENNKVAPEFAYNAFKFARYNADIGYLIAKNRLYSSGDAGFSWEKVTSLPIPVHHFIIDKTGNYIIVSTGRQDSFGGLYKSLDGGKNWQYISINIQEEISPVINMINAKQYDIKKRLIIDKNYFKKIPERLAWSESRTVFITSDNAINWHQTNTLNEYQSVKFVAAHPFDENSVYVYVSPEMYAGPWQLARVKFSGDEISGLDVLKPIDYFSDIKIAPSNPDILYIADNLGGLERSNDRGQTWTVQTSDDWGIPVIHPQDENILFSFDTKTIPDHYNEHNQYSDLIARSLDGGVHWAVLFNREYVGPNSRPWESLVKVIIDPDYTNAFYALFKDSLRYTKNLAESWQILYNSVNADLRDIQLDFDSGVIYLLKGEKDILLSENKGLSWNNISTELPVSHINNISLSPSSDLLFISANKGMYTYSPLTDNSGIQNHLLSSFSLAQNYPNPFNPETIITYELKIQEHIKLSVFNLTGKEIKTIVDKPQSAGEHTVVFNASGLSSGVYFYRLDTSSGFTQCRKMLYIK